MPTQSGMIQVSQSLQTRFNADGTVNTRNPLLDQLAGGMITNVDDMIKQLGFSTEITPETGIVANNAQIVGVDSDFRMPQVWKTSLAVDYEIPVQFPFVVTVEGMYTKNVNDVMLHNYNIKDNHNTWDTFAGSDNRYIYPSDYRHFNNVSSALLLKNTNKGHGYTFNVTLKAQPVRNMDVMLAYTRTEMKEVTGMPGSNANSAWVNMLTINGPNMSDAQRSQYVIPNQMIGSFSYRLPYLKDRLASTISIFYRGYSLGASSFDNRLNTFLYSNDINGDGLSNDLIYIPKAKGDIKFVSQADEDAFFAFMEQDSYLRKNKGKYAEAYAVQAPWVHKFDLRFLQDFKVKVGQTTNTLQLSFDVLNVGNLLNSKWGVNKNMAASNNGRILRYEGRDANNVPSFSMWKNSDGEYPTKTYDTLLDRGQCWSLQVGLRYIFN
jgi:hypothetical protein